MSRHVSALTGFAGASQANFLGQREQQFHQRLSEEVELLHVLGGRLRRIVVRVVSKHAGILGPFFHIGGQDLARCELIDARAKLTFQFWSESLERQLQRTPEAHGRKIKAGTSVRVDGLKEDTLRFGRNVIGRLGRLLSGVGLRDASDRRIDRFRARGLNGGIKIVTEWSHNSNTWHLTRRAEQEQRRHSCRCVRHRHDVEGKLSSTKRTVVHEGRHV